MTNAQPGHMGAGGAGEDTGPWPDSAGLLSLRPSPAVQHPQMAEMSSPEAASTPPCQGAGPLCSVFLG